MFQRYLPKEQQQEVEEATAELKEGLPATPSQGGTLEDSVADSPTSNYYGGLVTDPAPKYSTPDSNISESYPDTNRPHGSVSSSGSVASTAAVGGTDDRNAEEEEEGGSEFPLGSYRSHPRPSLDPRFYLVPNVHYDHSSPVITNKDGYEGSDLMSLNFSGVVGGMVSGYENNFNIHGYPPFQVSAPHADLGRGRALAGEMGGSGGGSGNNWTQAGDQSGNREYYSGLVSDDWSARERQSVEQPLGREIHTSNFVSDSDFVGVSSAHDTSYTLDEDEDGGDNNDDGLFLQPSDEFVHQSQVENDAFQPYASVPVLPSISGRGRMKELVDTRDRRIPKARVVTLQGGNWSANVKDIVAVNGVDKTERLPEKSANDSLRETAPVKKNGIFLDDVDASNRSSTSVAPNGAHQWSAVSPVGRKAESLVPANGAMMDSRQYDLGELSNGRSSWDVASELRPAKSSGADAASSTSVTRVSSIAGEDSADRFVEEKTSSFSASAVPPARSAEEMDVFSGSGSNGLARAMKSNGVENEVHPCLLCYTAYGTASELGLHCSTDVGHLEMAVLDSGAAKVWSFAPPPPQKLNASLLQVCTK